MCRVVECSVLLNVLGWKMFGDNVLGLFKQQRHVLNTTNALFCQRL
jgi:hypothetical protein